MNWKRVSGMLFVGQGDKEKTKGNVYSLKTSVVGIAMKPSLGSETWLMKKAVGKKLHAYGRDAYAGVYDTKRNDTIREMAAMVEVSRITHERHW